MVILLPVEVESYFDSLRVVEDFDVDSIDFDLASYSYYPKSDKNYAVYGVKKGSDDVLVAIADSLTGAENYASVMEPAAVFIMGADDHVIVQSDSVTLIGKADIQKVNEILNADQFVDGFGEGEEIICLSSKHKFGLSLDIAVRNGQESGDSAYMELSAYDPDGLFISSVDLLDEKHLASDYLFSVSYNNFEVNLRSVVKEGSEL